MFNQQLMNMKIQLKYLQNRTSNIRQDYIRKRYREAINHPLIDFTMRSLYCILPIDRPNFITLSHLFMKVDLNIKVKGYYIKLLLIAENNTIPLTNIGIANKLGISKNTVSKYNIELFQAGLLKLFPDRLELTPNELLISNDEAKQKKEWHPITGDLLPNITLCFNK